MSYPLISEYIEAIKAAEDNFDQLKHLRPVIGDDGLPVMTSGNFAVVFKMKDEQRGKLYALKCFTKEQEGRAEAYKLITEELATVDSPYILSIKYLEKELFVDTAQTSETEFPVLLMDWVEGKTLDKYLRENLDDKYALELLAYRFSQLAQWLMPQPFAHGDLKPDNILVREDGTLALVDYDGMYVPAMKGQKARELGSPDFRHPSRTEDDYDEHIDDFSLLVLTLSVLVAYNSPQYFSFPLLTDKDYINLPGSPFINKIYPSNNTSLNKCVSTLVNVLIDNDITSIISSYNAIAKHIRWDYYNYAQNYYGLLKEQHIDTYSIWTKFHRSGDFDIDERHYPVCLGYVEGFNVDHETGFPYYFHNGCLLSASDQDAGSYMGDEWEEDWTEMCVPPNTIVIAKDAFCNCAFVELVIVPNSVKFIGDYAFYNCVSLRYIVFPKSIEGFGTNIFNLTDSYVDSWKTSRGNSYYGIGAKSLVNIIVPNGSKEYYVNLLPDYQHLIVEFSEFINNLDPNIDPLVLGISKRVNLRNDKLIKFEGDDSVVEVPFGTKCICDAAFYGKKNLKKVVLPETIETYGYGIFKNCENLETIILPSNIKHIPNGFLFGCNKLKAIQIPDGVSSIGIGAFYNCNELTTLEIPEGVKTIGNYAFSGCRSLKEITIPNSVTTVGENVFDGCEKLCIFVPNGKGWKFEDLFPNYENKIIEQGGAVVTEQDLENSWADLYGVKYSSDGRRLLKRSRNINSYYIARGTRIIGNHAFANDYIGNFFNGTLELAPDTLTDITIPNTVVQIGEKAFWGCKSLKEVVIPDSVRTIGNAAFMDCRSMVKAVLSNSLTQINNDVFNQCFSLNQVNIPDSVLSINNYAFRYCKSLVSIDIPNSVKYIGREAFSSCHSLATIRISESVTSIGSSAFSDCYALKEICIPASITRIEEYTFYNCISLSRIVIPDSVTFIGGCSFCGCKSLEKIEIPESVIGIGYGAFNCCCNIYSIVVGKNNSTYDSRDSCNAIIETSSNRLVKGCQNSIIPNGVKEIEDYAFSDCKGMVSIIIPDSVTIVGKGAFSGCISLSEVVLPDSIINIKDDVFEGCENLNSIIIPKGSKGKFKKLLPNYKNKLIESQKSLKNGRMAFVKRILKTFT